MNENLTAVEVDEILEAVGDYEKLIAIAESERDNLIARYNEKITAARDICEQKCQPLRAEIALLTEKLRRYAEANITGKVRSAKFPSGTIAFRKQPPRYFCGDEEAGAQSKSLLAFVKANGGKYLKVAESVDWEHLKPRLKCIGDQVVYEETGEVISGMKAEILPDKFTVKTS